VNRVIVLRAAALVLFLAATAVGAFLLTQRPSKDEASVIAALEEAVIALRFPGSTVEEAAAELKTPENAAAFVRERVSETGYKGAIFTPEDVLQQRVGNRMDRARLLVALIEAQGGTAHIMADGRSAQRAQMTEPETPGALVKLAARLHVNTDEAETRAMERHRDRLLAIRDEIDASEALITELLGPRTVPEPSSVSPVPHLWVEGEDAQGAAFALAIGPDPVPAAGENLEAAPNSLALKVIGIGRDGARHVLLDYKGPVASTTSLSFQPVVGPVEAFGKPPSPESVPLWAPVLVIGDKFVGGTPFSPLGAAVPATEPGRPPLLPEPNGGSTPAPDIDDLRAVSIDTSGFPELRATLTGGLPEGEYWQAPWVDVFDDGIARHARISSLPQGGQTVLLLIDASASMAQGSRVLRARDLGRAIVSHLPVGTKLAIAGLNGEIPLVTRRPGIISAHDQQTLGEAVDAALVMGDGSNLPDMLETLLNDSELKMQAADIILIGDGAFKASERSELGSLLSSNLSRLFSVSIDAPGDAFAPVGDVIEWKTSESTVAETANMILRARGSQVTFAWQAPEEVREGQRRRVEFKPVAKNSRPATIEYVTPAPDTGKRDDPGLLASLALEITLPDGGTKLRPLFALGADADPWNLETGYRLTISPGPSPDRVLATAALEEWLALARARKAGEEAAATRVETIGFAALQKVSSLVGYRAVVTGVAPATTSPIVMLEHYTPFPQENALAVRRSLDLVMDGGLLDGAGPRAGLAVAAAEAALTGGASVNDRIRRADDRTVLRSSDTLPGWSGVLDMDGGEAIASPAAGAAWVLREAGGLEARLFRPVAKGASDVMIAGEFAAIRSRLEMVSITSGAAGSVAGVSGVLNGGVVGLLDQNLRLWCYSSVMMGYVADQISNLPTPGGGDPAAWRARALELCELANADGLAEAYLKSVGIGMAGGLLGDQLSALSGGLFSLELARRAAEVYRIFPRTLSPGEAGGISLFWNEILWFSEISAALDTAITADPGET
jgi:hypothetical protein